MNDNKIISALPPLVMLLFSLMIIYWVFGIKTMYSAVAVLVISTLIFRINEIMGLFTGKTKVLS